MIEWVPVERLEVVKAATPPLSAPVPKVVAPSRNVTGPVAVVGDTVAVKVTDCPEFDGLTLDVRPVLLLALFTVWVTAGEVLLLKLLSPP